MSEKVRGHRLTCHISPPHPHTQHSHNLCIILHVVKGNPLTPEYQEKWACRTSIMAASVRATRRLSLSLSRLLLVRHRSGGSAVSAMEQFTYSRPGLRAKVIDGKKIAEAVKTEVADQVRLNTVEPLSL